MVEDKLRINGDIRSKNVRLIGPDGDQVGIVPIAIAQAAAEAVDLDLVEVAPTANPPVVKVMDYGKYLYEQERAAREAKRNQKATGQKAMRLRPKIDDHDFDTKVRQARKFLQQGYSVRFQLMFRAREVRRPEVGLHQFDLLEEALADVGIVENRTGLQNRFATMVVSPKGSN